MKITTTNTIIGATIQLGAVSGICVDAHFDKVDQIARNAHLMEDGSVLCPGCYEDVQHDRRTDHSPGAWLRAVVPWSPLHRCRLCPSVEDAPLVGPTVPPGDVDTHVQGVSLSHGGASPPEGTVEPQLEESVFEPYRGEGWADIILPPPPPWRATQEGPAAPGNTVEEYVERPRIHPTMVCDACWDTELVLSYEPGEEGWYRCHCGYLHKPHNVRQEIAPCASGELPHGFSPVSHM